jgi:hypothetical protein
MRIVAMVAPVDIYFCNEAGVASLLASMYSSHCVSLMNVNDMEQ